MPDTLFYDLGKGDFAIVTLGRSEIECPTCKAKQDINKLIEAKKQPKDGCYRLRCKGCQRWLGATTCMTGDAVCWDELDAKKKQVELDKQPLPTAEEIAAFEERLRELAELDPEEETRKWLAEYDRVYQQKQAARRLAL